MIKGKRVYLRDLVEYDVYGDKPPKYASFHYGKLMDGPFTVQAAGQNRIAVEDEQRRIRLFFTGDIGLRPYPGGKFNEANTTHEMIPSPDESWVDDWF